MSRSSNRRPIQVWCHTCRSYFSDTDQDHRCTGGSMAMNTRPFVFPPKPTEANVD